MAVFASWDEIDEELDHVERGDLAAIAEVYLMFAGRPIMVSAERRGHVNLNNFSKHVKITRAQLQSWTRLALERERESA